ncbi:hypothetical protein AZI86_16200 [Bdellovibrio bacteriovorus]|uniref:Uncharacterized protein n=1 Tax=Bdellovibrio bacteriovorus TaxID=959 RepID=A0A150WH74_BDEBC|nr:DUF1513 domain-containing protein [Bdellovibrio bacteriovorus]KYG62378.1 hypothetical protein AZI86_16200 [Bdellovibrio bacteriovorus]
MSIAISRRKFLTISAVGVGTFALWRWVEPSLQEPIDAKFIIGDYDRRVDKLGRVGLISAKAELLRSWTIPLKAHSVWQNKARPWQLMAIEKDGLLGAVIDVQNEHMHPRIVQSPEGTRFYGHGFFSADGSLIYITAQKKNREGVILVYDSISMQVLQQIDSHGYRPHDLQVDLKNPDQFLIVNAGTRKNEANVSWISLATGKLERQIFLDKPGYAPGHIWQQPNGEIYFTGADNQKRTEDENISFSVYRPGKEIMEVVSANWGLTLKGETLNAFVDEANHRIWLTLTISDRILVVDKSSFEVIKSIDVKERPRSMVEIDVEGRRVLSVSYYRDGEDKGTQKFFDIQSFEEIKSLGSSKSDFYSIHLYPFGSLKKA